MSTKPPDCADCARVKSLEAIVERLERRMDALMAELEEARRAAKRQAAPFSKGKPKRRPKKPGRKPGVGYGERGSRSRPRRVDETVEAPLPPRCPHCGGIHIDEQAVHDQFQTDIPRVKPFTRRFRVHVGTCAGCGRRVQGRHGLQTSDALGAASVQIGPNVLALAAQMNKELGVTYGTIVVFFETAFAMTLSRATVCRANERLAEKARPTYDAMVLGVRGAMVVYSDETGWRIAGPRAWLWAFVTMEITLYVIRRSRGFDVVAEILGTKFAGLLGRDGWAPYRRLEARMDRILAGHITYAPNARFRKHLKNERDALFTYLDYPEIEASTWLAEQEIRPGVVNRKTSGGSRSDRGAEAQAILPSLIRTARRQHREPVGLMVGLLRARDRVDLGLARGTHGRARMVQFPCGQARASPAA